MKQPANCPALFLSAPASGQGKTTITASLARLLKRHNKTVRIFKTGPDYLDPQILEQASGHPVEQLDLWMCGEAYCRQRLFLAAQEADLILIEGAMGMFDGDPSSADLAAFFNIPVAIIMDVKGMAQTAAALASGLANFRTDVQVAGLIANNCASARHRELIENALPDDLPLLLAITRNEQVTLPERHLGLVQAHEITQQLELCFDAGAEDLKQAGALHILNKVPVVKFSPQIKESIPRLLEGKYIAVAKDAAFSFIYSANIKLLEEMGASINYFSPLYDQQLPSADALWLPGGYPELHAQALSENTPMLQAIQSFYASERPILAECGGFLYCLQTLTDLNDNTYPMAGILAGEATMRGKRGCQGMQSAPLPEGEITGHSHHRSRTSETPQAITYGKRSRHPAPGEPIYRAKGLTAGYLHLFFPSNPSAVAELFSGIEQI